MKLKIYTAWKLDHFNTPKLVVLEFRPVGEEYIDVHEHEVELDIGDEPTEIMVKVKRDDLRKKCSAAHEQIEMCNRELDALEAT